MYDYAYARALEAIAMGETRARTHEYLVAENGVPETTFLRAAADALTDGLRQGVEREDIDPSWFAKAAPLDAAPDALAYCCPIAYAQAVVEWHRRNGR